VEGLRTEAAKAKAVAERHQETVASLTADNLVFLMRLKRCEGDLVSAVQERDELRLAVEEQRGPWFEEVADMLTICTVACSKFTMNAHHMIIRWPTSCLDRPCISAKASNHFCLTTQQQLWQVASSTCSDGHTACQSHACLDRLYVLQCASACNRRKISRQATLWTLAALF